MCVIIIVLMPYWGYYLFYCWERLFNYLPTDCLFSVFDPIYLSLSCVLLSVCVLIIVFIGDIDDDVFNYCLCDDDDVYNEAFMKGATTHLPGNAP